MKVKSSLVNLLLKLSIVGVVGATFFTGCSTKLAMKTEKVNAQFSFDKKLKKSPSVPYVIGIVSPSLKKSEGKVYQTVDSSLRRALNFAIAEILTAKGFKTKGPYETFDDITYRDKKMIYLAYVPKLNLIVNKMDVKKEYHKLYYHETGIFTLSGSLEISVDEPMTGQAFIKKRINLADLDISEPYIYEKQVSLGDGSLTGALVDKIGASKVLHDNSEAAYARAVNKFYTKAVKRIEQYIDREEILSYKDDILKLKGLKRF
jgi:neuraminyllactose-binding hemagglutinin